MSVLDEVRAFPDALDAELGNGAPCEFCGDVRYIDVFEIFPKDRAFISRPAASRLTSGGSRR